MKFAEASARILAVGVLMAFASLAAAQQAYPNKPIRFIVPFPPGGSSDPVARLVGQKLSESWGQQVIVDNRPGGNTVMGSEALAKSPPDGYTILLVTPTTHVINSLLLQNLPYDSISDFAPVTTLTKSEYVLVLNPLVPANTLPEFIALVKSKPGELNYASSGTGTGTHLAGELFNIGAGVKIQHIPYKGGGQSLTDLMGGRVQLSFSVPIALIPHIKSGKLKAIAITGETRFSRLPQVPTFAEGGLPGYDLKSWQGIFLPGRTPRAIIDKLSTEIGRIMAMPDVGEKLDAQGMTPVVSTPEQFAEMINTDVARFAKIIKTANIKVEN